MEKPISLLVDFDRTTGAVKPMHGIGQPPLAGFSCEKFRYLSRAGIPFSRLHDVGGAMGGGLYVDIPNLFRDFSADENDPASYDFAFTDRIMEELVRAGCEPYFRLGVTIENLHLVKAYRIFPPADYDKWARVCEHVVRHYNEGWANGFHMGIRYFEIWNEPDDCTEPHLAMMWHGTPEEYYRLYAVTARHLKACFGDTIKVGGYGHCGVYEFEKDESLDGEIGEETYIYDYTISFMHGFFRYIREAGAPLDFFSWHVYDNCHSSTREDFRVIARHADYVRRILDRYGYTDAEHHLNEWNLHTDREHRDAPVGAAKSLAFMTMMQRTSTDLMCFYDGGIGYSPYRALINPDTGYPYRTYYAFMMFGTLYRLGKTVASTCEDGRLFSLAARRGRQAALVLANPSGEELSVSLSLTGFCASACEVLRIDEENRYTCTGEDLADGTLTLPPFGCAEIRLYDLK
ncbi:MAG: hypothetical protein IJV96_07975 [Clostridia bacterium]|nr:hypothetical protein [Clostridia bacterium]